MIVRIAHRGAKLEAPENTMSAFTAAFNQGATNIECDVRLTSDNVPIIMHDATLERTTNGNGPVDQCTYQTIQSLDAGSWFHEDFKGTSIPQLSELLRWQKQSNIALHLEIKPMSPEVLNAGLDVILKQVHAFANTEKIFLLSFQYAVLERLQELNSPLPRVLSVFHCQQQDIENAAAVNCRQINSCYNHVCRKSIQDIQDRGFQAGIFTIDHGAQIKELTQYNVDAVFIDDMRLLNENTLSLGR